MVPTLRLRGKGSDTVENRKKAFLDKKKRDAFSDDEEFEDVNLSSCASTEKTSIGGPDVGLSMTNDMKNKGREVSFALPSNHAESVDENEEVEQELDLLSKAIHISNIDEIDHVGLMRGMHERFQRKQLKWQKYASMYSKWAFGINFLILLMQIVQMLFHQLVEIFNADSSKIQAMRCVLAALTAILAGLQMKLKLTEKAEKYRRGAKVYARLHRISTYYLMLAENGGKVEDVTGLWREAMKREGKWIPVIKTFMAT